MNRNQKIALGCGGAGCLGLIVLAVIGVFGYMYMNTSSSPFANSNRNSNLNINTNSSESSNTAVEDPEDTSSTSMSDDDKHKLFHAATLTSDNELVLKVMKRIGFPTTANSEYQEFVKEHFSWAMRNLEFVQTVNTPEKGRAYVEAHMGD